MSDLPPVSDPVQAIIRPKRLLAVSWWIAVWSFSTLVFMPVFSVGFAIVTGYDPADWAMSRFDCWKAMMGAGVYLWAFGMAAFVANAIGNKLIGPNGEKLLRRLRKNSGE